MRTSSRRKTTTFRSATSSRTTRTTSSAIICNVKAAPSGHGGGAGDEKTSSIPARRMVFNRIQNLNNPNPAGFVDIVHDTNTVTIRNTGMAADDHRSRFVRLDNGTRSNVGVADRRRAPRGPTLRAAARLNMTVKFVARRIRPQRQPDQRLPNDERRSTRPARRRLERHSSDQHQRSGEPDAKCLSWPYWQNTSENENEPGLQTIVNWLYGYGTTSTHVTHNTPTTTPRCRFIRRRSELAVLAEHGDPTLPARRRNWFRITASTISQTMAAGSKRLWALSWYPQAPGTNNIPSGRAKDQSVLESLRSGGSTGRIP